MIDGRFHYDNKEFQLLNNIDAKTYFTTGNHETYAGIGLIDNLLNNTKVNILRNQTIMANNIHIIGIDDSDDTLQVRKQLGTIKIDESKYTILMYHRPSGFKDAASSNIDLMLTGHTHAGQIYPFNFLIALFNGYVRGLHHINQSYIYVCEGIGTWGPPMRLGTKAELVNIIVYPNT